ncbi:MAG: NAD(P)-binding domain-containing protein [Kofleriaceae bacterium]
MIVGVCGQGPIHAHVARAFETAIWDPSVGAAAFVAKLTRPRTLVVCVEGAAADEILRALVPQLEPGDLVIHGATEHFQASRRRAAELEAAGIRYVDVGVGIGPEASAHGPALAVGGSLEAFEQARPVLERIAVSIDDRPGVERMGAAGAGQLVKMLQMGIEYADMHALAEGYDVLHAIGGLTNAELADTFESWNRGELESLFVAVTPRIFRNADSLVDLIADTCGMKPPGKWIVKEAVDAGIAIPAIASSVEVRLLSAQRPPALAIPATSGSEVMIDDVRRAIYGAKLCTYAQVFALARHWDIPLAAFARLGRAGCTIRGAVFAMIERAYQRDPELAYLLLDPEIAGALRDCEPAWRRVVTLSIQHAIGLPALTASLTALDTLRRARLPLNLILAQRDLVGGIAYQRTDRDGAFHTEW